MIRPITGMSAKLLIATALATTLLRTSPANGPESARARAELGEVSHEVSDLIADHLVRAMDRDALEVCSVYSNHTVPLWFDSGRQKMIAKLTALAERDRAEAEQTLVWLLCPSIPHPLRTRSM